MTRNEQGKPVYFFDDKEKVDADMVNLDKPDEPVFLDTELCADLFEASKGDSSFWIWAPSAVELLSKEAR